MKTKRWGRLVGGTTLIGAGIASLVIPVLPGVLIVAAGLGVLAPEVPAAQRAIDRIRAAYKQAG
jgi:hypothetical protein